MRRLLLFNSSNDLALATGTHEYIAPKSVAKMEKELATLPAWWGEEGDAVIVGSSEDVRLSAIISVSATSVLSAMRLVPFG